MSRSRPSTREGAAYDPAYDDARPGDLPTSGNRGGGLRTGRKTSGALLAGVCLIIIVLALIAIL